MTAGPTMVPWAPATPEPPARPGVAPLGPDALRLSRPDAFWLALDADGAVVGRCAAWWRDTPSLPAGRCGFIGHWAATDDQAVAQALLSTACDALRATGCAVAAGPVDGSTWRSYRFVTGGTEAPPFFMEPTNPPEHPRQFTAFGFRPLASYHSSIDAALDEQDEQDEQTDRAEQRMRRAGVSLRPLDTARAAEELRAIHGIVTVAFRHALLYQPLPLAEFIGQYELLRPHLAAEWVTVAMHGDRPVGFVFAVPDLLQARAGRAIDQAIIKTLAVLPGRDYAGLGAVLIAAGRATARAAGCRRVIHALMHEANYSRRIRAEFTQPLRRYEVYALPL